MPSLLRFPLANLSLPNSLEDSDVIEALYR